MRTLQQRFLIIAALMTFILAVPALAEDQPASQPPVMDDVQGEAVREAQPALEGEQCRAEQGAAAEQLTVDALAAFQEDAQYLQSTPCQAAAGGAEAAAVPACSCVVGLPCTRPCPSATQTPQCLDIDCILAPNADFNGVCVCVG